MARYSDHPAPCTPLGGLEASSEAHLGERWGCRRESWRGHIQPDLSHRQQHELGGPKGPRASGAGVSLLLTRWPCWTPCHSEEAEGEADASPHFSRADTVVTSVLLSFWSPRAELWRCTCGAAKASPHGCLWLWLFTAAPALAVPLTLFRKLHLSQPGLGRIPPDFALSFATARALPCTSNSFHKKESWWL